MGRVWLTICTLGAAFACALLSPAAVLALGSGAVSGSVEDAGTHAPLEEIQACAYRAASFEYAGCDSTDASGDYTIPTLTAGAYKVQFTVSYLGGANYLSQYYDGKSSWAEATPVSVSEGATTSSIDAAMDPGGQISGTVTDGASNPIEGLQVCAHQPGGSAFTECDSTDADGDYTISNLPTGSYKVKFSHGLLNYVGEYYDGKSTEAAADTVDVVAGSKVPGIDAQLEEGGQVAGTVVAAAGKAPVQNVEVCAYPSGSPEPLTPCAYTGASGDYTLSGLATGSYKLRFRPETFNPVYAGQYYDGKSSLAGADAVPVAAGAVVPDADAELVALGKIAGNVSEAGGAALAGIAVCAESTGYETPGERCGSTDSSGDYTITGLAEGSYLVTFKGDLDHVTQYYDGKASKGEASPVPVSLGTTKAGVDAELAKSGRIAGKVLDASSSAPLEGIEVCARRTPDLAATACAFTDASGKYTIGSLPESTYEVRFSPPLSGPSQNYLGQYYDGRVGIGEGDPVAVTVGATTASIDAALQPAGRIAGTVTGADTEAPLEGVWVCANPAKRGAPAYSTCTVSGGGGEYTLSGLSSGSYKVHFRGGFGPSSSYFSQYYDGKPSFKLADPVPVTAGSTTAGIDVALGQSGKIAGTVIDAGSKAPIQSVQVCASRSGSEPALSRCTQTGLDGSYTIMGLAGGAYTVSFGPGYGGILNYLGQYYDGRPGNEDADPVAVTAGSTTAGIDAEMAPAGKISGKVIDAASKDPAPRIRACAIGPSAEEEPNCDTTDDEGRYTILGLPTGSYRVRFSPGTEAPFGPSPNYNYVPRYYDGKASEGEADPVAATAGGETTGIDAEMEEGGKVAGQVVAAGGEAPIRNVEVCAYATADDEFSQCASTDHQGEYTIEGLPAGSYKVWFSGGYGGPVEGEAGYLSQYYDGKASEAEAEPVSVALGATTSGIDAKLLAGGQIEGLVTAVADGAPLRYVEVCALEPGGEEEPVRCGGTDGKGEYTISGLATGSYKVMFSAGFYEEEEEEFVEEFVTQYYSGQASAALSSPVSVTAGAVTGSIDAKMSEPGEEQPGGGGDGGGGSAGGGSSQTGPAPPPVALAQPPSPKAPRSPKCKKGFVKKRVHGKARCVKVKPHRKKR